MLLVGGPPGSGKTHHVLDQARSSLSAGNTNLRLLTPTATMAEHLRNRLAREGLVFDPGAIQTLSKFVEGIAPQPEQVTPAVLQLLVEAELDRETFTEFGKAQQFAGFREAITSLINEFALAGCDSELVGELMRKHGLEAPYGAAIKKVMAGVEHGLGQRKLATRAARLRAATKRVREHGVPGVERILMDGFTSFSDLELALIETLCTRADLTITLPSSSGAATTRERLQAMGFSERSLPRMRAQPEEVLFVARTATQEAEEIARRILTLHAEGRSFREMGVVVRSEVPFVPVLRSTFDRFGIPSRFYFPEPLETHPTVRFLGGIVDGLLGGWPLDQAMAVLRAGFGHGPECDRLDFEVREQLPAEGLGRLRKLTENPLLLETIRQLESLEPWRGQTLKPAEWATRVASLSALFVPPGIRGSITPLAMEAWRSQAWAVRQFEAAMREAAESFAEDRTISLADFWQTAKAVVRQGSLRVPDHRRDVVHVMDVLEARQWELPVVFVCALLEKQFPKYHSQNPLLPDFARVSLNQDGMRLRTSKDQQDEESYFFDVAVSRATVLQVLSYPRFNSKGDENLPSFFLADRKQTPLQVRPVRPMWHWERVPLPARPALREQQALDAVIAKHQRFSPTTIEKFLHCPYQFFANETLRLQSAPASPDDRLDALLKGTIVHSTIKSWHIEKGDIAELLDELFDAAIEEQRVPVGFRSEAERLLMQRVLTRFAADPHMLDGWELHLERKVDLQLREDVRITGRVDRFEVSPKGGLVVLDYKYSGSSGVDTIIQGHKDGKNVQSSIYLLALARELGLTPAGMFYWGLKALKKPAIDGWYVDLPDWKGGEDSVQEELDERLEASAAAVLSAVDGIRAGRIEATPEERTCGYCDFFDVCRTRIAVELEAEAGVDE